MTHPTNPQQQLDLFTGLSNDALSTCINYLNTEILSGNPQIWEVANFAYKLYSKACCLEQFAQRTNLQKISRLKFQSMVDPVAQSIWAFGDKDHAHLFNPINQ
jgi:hypothetical protein